MFPVSFLFSLFIFPVLALWPFEQGGRPAEIKKSSLAIPAALKASPRIRVLLETEGKKVTLQTRFPYAIADSAGRGLMSGVRLEPVSVQLAPEGFRVGNQLVRATTLLFDGRGEGFKVNQRLYRGNILIMRSPGGELSVVNDVDLEEYIKGVLPSEISPNWPPEALKAQAVAARTFAVFKEIENQARYFALSNNVMGQVYRGRSEEDASSNAAVDATRGKILTLRGEIFPAYFHSTCGGKTTRADYQWNIEPHPSLRGVRCDFCRASPYFKWTARLSRMDIEKKLRKEGFSVALIDWIRPRDYDESARVRSFAVGYKGKETLFNANNFRVWVGAFKIKSTLISGIDHVGEDFIFKGKGFGHGVGLCQYGVKNLAELGYNYRQILEYYYPNAVLGDLK